MRRVIYRDQELNNFDNARRIRLVDRADSILRVRNQPRWTSPGTGVGLVPSPLTMTTSMGSDIGLTEPFTQ